ncbi:hypothetical protein LJR289_000216 [Pseudoduganella sp. LjRoot289]|uniref:hypothetical protein n=1 Tax=Pseudoduganella sp. LjRoot289 TaxID=3342314 RepID=UPI003ECE8D33
MTRELFCLAACALGLLGVQQAGAATPAAELHRLQIFQFPEPVRYTHHNDDFTVRVRVPGGVWRDLYEYRATVDLDSKQDASMVYFNFDGSVEVAVQKNNGNASRVVVRPDSKGVKAALKDGVAYFTLDKPQNLSVEFDGDKLHNLHLFTHAIRKDMPSLPADFDPKQIAQGKTPDFTQKEVFFGPGIHSGKFRVRSNSNVYIHGSAILTSPLIIDRVENVRVVSDGLFHGVDGFAIRNSRNVLVDGAIFINQPGGTMGCTASDDVESRSIRTIGGGKWSDGLPNYSCSRVKISDSFIRTSDDCITVYNHRGDTWGSSRDFNVTNTTLWADVAHAIMIGIHGNTPTPAHPEPEVIEGLRFSNIDILEHDEDDPEYEGAIGIMAGDDNLVRDVVFDGIRVDHIEEGKLFNFHIAYTPKYNTSPGRGIEDITLRNVSYSGKGSPSASAVYGHDAARKVRNIVLENVTVGGKRLTGPENNVLDIGPFAEGVVYK